MPAGASGDSVTESGIARWVVRWAAGAGLGQIVFTGTVQLVLAVLLGSALGGLTVWLLWRRSTRPAGRRARRGVRTTDPGYRTTNPGYRTTNPGYRVARSGHGDARPTYRDARPAPTADRPAPRKKYSPLNREWRGTYRGSVVG